MIEMLSLRGLDTFRRESHCYSLRSFFLHRMVPHIQQFRAEGMLPIIVVTGLPGSGKSRFIERLEQGLDDKIPGYEFTTLTFEKDGLRPAKEAGLITSGLHGERSKEEHSIESRFFLDNALASIAQHRPLIMELPVNAGLPHYLNDERRQWQIEGVDAGLSTLLTLLDLQTIRLIFIGIVAGSDLRAYTESYRTAIKVTQSLEEGQLVAYQYKRSIPQTVEEWQLMILEGASAATIRMLHRETYEAAIWLMRRKDRGLNRLGRLIGHTDAYVLPRHMEIERGIVSETYLFRYFQKRVLSNRAGLDPRDMFFGFNNPHSLII